MAPRFLTILTGRNLPKIRQKREPELSIINEKTIAVPRDNQGETAASIRMRMRRGGADGARA